MIDALLSSLLFLVESFESSRGIVFIAGEGCRSRVYGPTKGDKYFLMRLELGLVLAWPCSVYLSSNM